MLFFSLVYETGHRRQREELEKYFLKKGILLYWVNVKECQKVNVSVTEKEAVGEPKCISLW